MKLLSTTGMAFSLALAALSVANPARAAYISDSFTLESPDRDAGDALHGQAAEVGGQNWIGYVTANATASAPFFGGDATNGYIKGATANASGSSVGLLPFAYTGTDRITVQADVKSTTVAGWVGVGFSKAVGTFNGNGQVWMYVSSAGGWLMFQDGTSKILASGSALPGFSATEFTNLAISYDPTTKVVTGVIGSTEVAKVTLTSFTPDTSYVGFQMASPRDGTALDNFVVTVPEPSSLLLVGSTLMLLPLRRRRGAGV